MVEAAIVGPLFFLLIFAFIEGGLLFRTYLTASNASRDGARAGAAADNRSYADFEILQTVARDTAAVSRRDVMRIVVFLGSRTDGYKSTPRGACRRGVATRNLCNVYNASDLSLTRTQFGASSYRKDDSWPGTARDYNLGGYGARSGTDYLGVQVVVRHQAVTGVLGSTRDVTVTTVMRLEPMEASQ